MSTLVWQVSAGLEAMEKYVLEYIVNSPYRNSLGYYRLPITFIQYDTGLDEKTVEAALEGLISKKFISYDKDKQVVAVKNFHRFYKQDGLRGATSILSILEQQPTSPIVRTVIDWKSKSGAISASEKTCMEESDWVKEALSLEFHPFTKEDITNTNEVKSCAVESASKKTMALPQKDFVSKCTQVLKEMEVEHQQKPEQELIEAPVPILDKPKEVVTPPEVNKPVPVDTGLSHNDASENEPEMLSEKASSMVDSEQPVEEISSREKVDPVAEKNSEDFESLWKKYPRKESKALAKKGYLAMLKKGEITFEVASHAVDNYVYSIKKNKTEEKYIISGRNFFSHTQKRILEYVDSPENSTPDEAEAELKKKVMPKFNMFWAVYPRKNGREGAEKNFVELIKNNEFDSDQLIEAARGYARECRAKNTEEQYIKRADTFLDVSTRPFRDYIDREDLSSFNTFSGEVEPEAENGVDEMLKFIGQDGENDASSKLAEAQEEKGTSDDEQGAVDAELANTKAEIIEGDPAVKEKTDELRKTTPHPIVMQNDDDDNDDDDNACQFDPDIDEDDLGLDEDLPEDDNLGDGDETDWSKVLGEEDMNPENW